MYFRLSRNKWLAITRVCKNRNYTHLFGPFWLFDVAVKPSSNSGVQQQNADGS